MTDTLVADSLLAEIERRTERLLRRLAAGDDAPPAALLRLEGLLEAAVLVGVDSAGLDRRLDELHQSVCGESLAAHLGEDWRDAHPFPELPFFMARAPVSPSTRD